MDFIDDINQSWSDLVDSWNDFPEPIQIFFLLIGYIILLIITLRIVRYFIDRYSKKLTPTTYQTLKTISRMVIILLFAVAFLNQFEQFQGSFIGLSALLGTAIGFASTQTVGNMISGLYLMISRPFFIRDYVILPKLKIEGIIKEITINYTRIQLTNGTTAIVSNRSLLNTEVINTRYELDVEEDEEISKDKKNSEDDSLDMQSVGQEIKQLFRKIKAKKTIVYIYPIRFTIDVNEKQKVVNSAIKELEKYLEDTAEVKDMNWKIVSRSRLDIGYEINVMVENPFHIFRVTSTALNKLEIFLEKAK
ncbi:MAG: mechanosensitive ion channel domain-containing protein [Candidatus Hodarchaeales archaeon]|jgi:hypothetical protein